MRALNALLACSLIIGNSYAGGLEIIHINIGQGDATLILGPASEDGSRRTVLYDAGNIPGYGAPDGGKRISAVLTRRGITKINYFIASSGNAEAGRYADQGRGIC